MALWQFKISFVPQKWLATGHDIQSLFTEAGYNSSRSWRDYVNPDLLERSGAILPPGKSWHDSMLLWGSGEGNNLQLWRHKSLVTEMTARFDLRHPDIALFRAITGMAADLDLAIVDPLGKRIVRTNANALLRVAAESDAAHFVIDPLSFLAQLDAGSAKAT